MSNDWLMANVCRFSRKQRLIAKVFQTHLSMMYKLQALGHIISGVTNEYLDTNSVLQHGFRNGHWTISPSLTIVYKYAGTLGKVGQALENIFLNFSKTFVTASLS